MNGRLKDIPQSVFTLLDVPSFGPKKAYRLTAEFKLRNPETVLDDLEKIAKNNKIAPLKGFGEKSQADILQAIAEFQARSRKNYPNDSYPMPRKLPIKSLLI